MTLPFYITDQSFFFILPPSTDDTVTLDTIKSIQPKIHRKISSLFNCIWEIQIKECEDNLIMRAPYEQQEAGVSISIYDDEDECSDKTFVCHMVFCKKLRRGKQQNRIYYQIYVQNIKRFIRNRVGLYDKQK